MTENRGQSKRISRRANQRIWRVIDCFADMSVLAIAIIAVVIMCTGASGRNLSQYAPTEDVAISPPFVITVTMKPACPIDEADEADEADELIKETEELNNDESPYSIVSEDLGVEVTEQGWVYYDIPSSYKLSGGRLPEIAQAYLWKICNEAGVDYYMVLALIERESGYKYDAVGDNGNAKGLMQIQERWHKDRMQEVGATDLHNPYDNMRVGVNFLKEIQDVYLDNSGAHCVLMVYNMGVSGASKLWAEGIYSTNYTRQILQRAEEIKVELQD